MCILSSGKRYRNAFHFHAKHSCIASHVFLLCKMHILNKLTMCIFTLYTRKINQLMILQNYCEKRTIFSYFPIAFFSNMCIMDSSGFLRSKNQQYRYGRI